MVNLVGSMKKEIQSSSPFETNYKTKKQIT